ncbi:hypothetical protein ACFQHV_20950 [Promicromonospora thailandica]|uniref:Uncharacterized protein n=1 Tax=Promicromonospora thailandica TaxID=765201 RepID=A0A9X2JXY9_9MICO|nr:hypothetical protein [Promicromonospora thailandica]MCP2266688.1 hypothetical protein [Promicromonospora thailandica]BFF17226.1 hypothetical protein GCM10025730_07470 [Promicromonospora thailandica]
MTNLTGFSETELDQILDAPGAVLKAATLADGQPGGLRFLLETAAGARVFREAQEHENDFVRAVSVALRDRVRAKEAAAAEVRADPAAAVGVAAAAAATEEAARVGAQPDPEGAADQAVELTAAAVTLLRGRVPDADLAAYGEWLLRIAGRVAGATRSRTGGLFSKRVKLSVDEQAYLDRLAAAVAG